MSRVFFVIMCLMISQLVYGQEGVVFRDIDSWQEALDLAGKEEKLIFLDCYTSWCGPCKMMERQVFNQKDVGDYFNKYFINVKLNMEKDLGIQIAEKYKVRGYPTLLFIEYHGEIVHKIVGAVKDPAMFLEFSKLSRTPGENLVDLARKYNTTAAPDFSLVRKYLRALNLSKDRRKAQKVVKKYLDTLDPIALLTPDHWQFVTIYLKDPLSRHYVHLLANASTLYDHRPGELVDQKFYDDFDKAVGTLENDAKLHPNNSSDEDEKKLIELLGTYKFNNSRSLWSRLVALRYIKMKEWDFLLAHIDDVTRNGLWKEDKGGDQRIFGIVNMYMGKVRSENYLRKALPWLEYLREKDKTKISYLTTHINLLHRIGETIEAQKLEEIRRTLVGQ